jgi:hypothetical protein
MLIKLNKSVTLRHTSQTQLFLLYKKSPSLQKIATCFDLEGYHQAKVVPNITERQWVLILKEICFL